LGNKQKCIDDLNQAIFINPICENIEIAYYIRACAYYELKDQQKALEDVEKAVKIKPNYLGALMIRGLFFHDMGRYQQAIDSYTQIIDIEPSNFEAYNRRSTSRLALGDYQGATEDLEKAKILLTFKT
jgi:tetratricopeptide (TPR) repeat protein